MLTARISLPVTLSIPFPLSRPCSATGPGGEGGGGKVVHDDYRGDTGSALSSPWNLQIQENSGPVGRISSLGILKWVLFTWALLLGNSSVDAFYPGIAFFRESHGADCPVAVDMEPLSWPTNHHPGNPHQWVVVTPGLQEVRLCGNNGVLHGGTNGSGVRQNDR